MLGKSSSLTPSPSAFLIKLMQWVDGRKASKWASEITGLNQSNFRFGKKFSPRQSTLEKIKINSLSKVSLEHQKEIPSLINEYPSLFQDFVYSWFDNKQSSLYFLAKEIDELDFALVQAQESESLSKIKETLLGCNFLVNEIYWTEENQPTGKLKTDLSKSPDIDSVLAITQKLSFNIFLSFIAAVDLHFCSEAFGKKLKLRPLFLYLLPKANFYLDLDKVKLPKRNRFKLPPRNLLELTHAIFYLAANNQWPDKALGSQEMTVLASYDPEKNEVDITEKQIEHLFSGRNKLKAETYESICRGIYKKYKLSSKTFVPWPLYLATILWQNSFVHYDSENKKSSIVLLNPKIYQCFWDAFYSEWASHLQSGATDWPKWLDN